MAKPPFCLVGGTPSRYKRDSRHRSARLDEAELASPHGPMALSAPDKVYDFTGNAALGLPVPGDRVDAQFLTHRQAILDTQAALLGVIRTDGALKNGIVGVDQMDAGLIAQLTGELTASINAAEASFFEARDDAAQSRTDTIAAAAQAVAQAAIAVGAASQALASQGTASSAATDAQNALTATTNAIASFNTILGNALNDIDGANANSTLYAQLSQAWAEHMPGTIPPDVLATMNITGDHWSARWWANFAETQVQGLQAYVDQTHANALAAQASADDAAATVVTAHGYADAAHTSELNAANSAAGAAGLVANLNSMSTFLNWGLVTEDAGALPTDYGALTE